MFHNVPMMEKRFMILEHTTGAIAATTGGGAFYTGLMTYLNENAQGLGIIISGAMLLVAVIFGTLNYRLHKKRLEDE